MKILLPDNTPFDLDQPTSKLIDSKMCVLDYSEKDYVDFFWKKITTFISYRYPTAELLIGNRYRIELPLNWKILVTNKHDYICRLVPIEDLLHFENQVLVCNPLHIGLPKILDVEINRVNPNQIEHFVPKLPKKNVLVMPIGSEKEWETRTYDEKGNIKKYPECIFAVDDLEASRLEMDLDDIVGD